MIKLYKDLNIGYNFSVAAGVLFAVVMIFKDQSYILIYTSLIIWFFLMGFIFGTAAIKRLNKINYIMNQQCHGQEFLQQLLCLQENSKGKAMELFFATNLAAGYLNLGDADTALFHLNNVTLDEKNHKRRMHAMLMAYYNNYAMACMMKQDWETANTMLSNMKNLLETAKLKPAARQNFEKLYQIKCMRMRAFQRNYEGCEEFCMNTLEHSGTLLEQVALIDLLRDVYLHEGRWQEAQKCKEFILENGGDTYYVAKANAEMAPK